MSENSLISVLIADDDAGMRLILRKKIEATDGFTIAGEAASGHAYGAPAWKWAEDFNSATATFT